MRGVVAATVDGMVVGERPPRGLKMLDDGAAHHVLVSYG